MESLITRHEPLYLKYRPQSLGQLVGQEAVTRTLTNAITYSRLTHAYLFTGPRGTGKTSSARILAKSLNCEASSGATVTPCQECSPCKEITAGISPAVMEIDAASNNSVDDARLLIERAPLKAVGGRNKIYIIDECHMLTKEAFNALLKTIEQPPPDVVFILATTEEHKVLPTIISRCQRLMFRNVEQNTLTEHLRKIATKENIEIEDEALRVIARRSGGGLRDALSTLDQASLLGAPGRPVSVNDLLRLMGALHEDVLLSLSEKILSRDGHGVLQSVAALLGEGREPSVLAREMAAHFLNLAKSSYLARGTSANVDDLRAVVLGSDQYLAGLLVQAPKFENSELSQIIEALDKLETSCRRTTQPTMHLEMGLLSVCHRHDMLLINELSERVARLEAMLQDGARRPEPSRPAPPPAQAQQQQYSSSQPVSHQQTPAHAAPTQPINQPSMQSSAPAPSQGGNYAGTSSPPAVPQASPQNNSSSSASPDYGSSTSAPITSSPPQEAHRQAYTTPSAQPVPEPGGARSEAPISGGTSGASPTASGSIDDVEFVWSRVLDELHRINIPTHGIFNSKLAFLVDMTDEEMVFGVKTANFQKTLEQKTNHLKSACKAVIGRELNIRVKIVAGDAKPIAAASAPPRRPPMDDYSQPQQERSYAQTAVMPQPGSDTGTAATTSQTSSDQAGTTGDTKVEFENGAVKEAYKLFEGPGSRRIQ